MTGRELYRDPVNGKLTGVCAGLADYFGLEVWLVRILVITVSLLGAFALVGIAYIALTLMLEKQPPQYQDTQRNRQSHTLKSTPWEQGNTAAELLQTLDHDLNQAEQRVRKLEAYVTSEAFKVNREFRNL